MTYQEEFITFMVRAGVLTFGDFTTKSGRRTPYFINSGNYKTGAQAAKLGDYYAACIQQNLPDGVDCLFGPAYKGIIKKEEIPNFFPAAALSRLNSGIMPQLWAWEEFITFMVRSAYSPSETLPPSPAAGLPTSSIPATGAQAVMLGDYYAAPRTSPTGGGLPLRPRPTKDVVTCFNRKRPRRGGVMVGCKPQDGDRRW